jgi:hypothetical protein
MKGNEEASTSIIQTIEKKLIQTLRHEFSCAQDSSLEKSVRQLFHITRQGLWKASISRLLKKSENDLLCLK